MQVEQEALSANDSLSEDEEYVMYEVNREMAEKKKEDIASAAKESKSKTPGDLPGNISISNCPYTSPRGNLDD
jgi:hypothetical protein